MCSRLTALGCLVVVCSSCRSFNWIFVTTLGVTNVQRIHEQRRQRPSRGPHVGNWNDLTLLIPAACMRAVCGRPAIAVYLSADLYCSSTWTMCDMLVQTERQSLQKLRVGQRLAGPTISESKLTLECALKRIPYSKTKFLSKYIDGLSPFCR